MIIGIDIDEVLADLMTDVLIFHNSKYDTSFKKEDVFSFNLRDVWGVTEEEAVKRFHEFFDSEEFKSLKPVKGSVQAVKSLAKDHTLIVITARPDGVKKNTLNWLKNNFPDVFKEIHFTNEWGQTSGKKRTKGEICVELGVELMVEDCVEYSLSIASKNIPVILLDTPWNKDFVDTSLIKRAKDWADVLVKIDEFAKEEFDKKLRPEFISRLKKIKKEKSIPFKDMSDLRDKI